MMKQITCVAALLAFPLAGCGMVSPSFPGGTACTVARDVPAQFFAIEAPKKAEAGKAFPVTVWVRLPEGGGGTTNRIAAGDLRVAVAKAQRRITVSGTLHQTVPNPAAADTCAYPASYQPEQAVRLQIQASAPAGTYEVRIAPDAFTTERSEIFAGEPFDGSGTKALQPIASVSVEIK